ncbi:MAG TPA: response regulator [Pseudolabrys sp.]|jgi:FixJ family two-component response regulator
MVEDQCVVAVVDDDEGLRDALELLLASLGFQIELYASAEEFLAEAMDSRASCLLVDLHLGDISGVELVRQLSSIDCPFPVIFMTGSCDAVMEKQAMEAGCIAFLHKPFPEDQLLESIKRAVRVSQGSLH